MPCVMTKFDANGFFTYCVILLTTKVRTTSVSEVIFTYCLMVVKSWCFALLIFFPVFFFFSSSEPTSVDLHVDGVTDICTKEEDINFVFTGFSVAGTVRRLQNVLLHNGIMLV